MNTSVTYKTTYAMILVFSLVDQGPKNGLQLKTGYGALKYTALRRAAHAVDGTRTKTKKY